MNLSDFSLKDFSLNKTVSLGDNHSTTMWNIASSALQIGSGLFNFFNQASATRDYNNQVAANYRTQMGQLQTQQAQQARAAAQQQSSIAREAAAERSRIMASTGEAGIEGATASRIATESQFRASDATQMVDTNLNNQFAQGYRQAESMRSQAQSNMKSSPSLLGLGLQIGTVGLDLFNPKETAKRPSAARKVTDA